MNQSPTDSGALFQPPNPNKVIGSLIGGAIGDAMGAPLEFRTVDGIRRRFGRDGVSEPAQFGSRLNITDDTQMTLFTAEGILRHAVRFEHKGIASLNGLVHLSYLRWFITQGGTPKVDMSWSQPGWLIGEKALWRVRAPGTTCISSLRQYDGRAKLIINTSKGCGGVMRAAPFGLVGAEPTDVYKAAHDASALTHGHFTGQIAAGAFAMIIAYLTRGEAPHDAIEVTLDFISEKEDADETISAIKNAVAEAKRGRRFPIPASLGQGWVAEEALAIGLYCLLTADSFQECIRLAINHDGDSDSTGSIAGQLWGAAHGLDSIPESWLDMVEEIGIVRTVAQDLADLTSGSYSLDDFEKRYPGN